MNFISFINKWIEEEKEEGNKLRKRIEKLKGCIDPVIEEDELDTLFQLLDQVNIDSDNLKKETEALTILREEAFYKQLKNVFCLVDEIKEEREVVSFLMLDKKEELKGVEVGGKKSQEKVEEVKKADEELQEMCRVLDQEAKNMREKVLKNEELIKEISNHRRLHMLFLLALVMSVKLKKHTSIHATLLQSYLTYKALEALLFPNGKKIDYERICEDYQSELEDSIRTVEDVTKKLDSHLDSAIQLKQELEKTYATYLEISPFKEIMKELSSLLFRFEETRKELDHTNKSLNTSLEINKVKIKTIEG